ncbi:MAG: hypothetical protein A2259_01670 [Candidatus Moranbacteria bacterium RIFOXYA2_FULL_43_15]|nr:MAG: hypothetical protein A2259_01670 [Candidatus Moranbacteria bacterium RIFOXYA2_FULL_43_15]
MNLWKDLNNMKSRVKFNLINGSPGTGMGLSWDDLVAEPFNAGFYAESFASADALIDDHIESLMRQVYNEFKCQDLINELRYLRNKTNLQGLVILEILKSKTVIDEKLYQRVLNFKKARNLVLHDIKREYALVPLEDHKKIKDQKEFDDTAMNYITKWIDEGKKIFQDLGIASSSIYKKEEQFFSHDFYQKNPRVKQIKKKYPLIHKK